MAEQVEDLPFYLSPIFSTGLCTLLLAALLYAIHSSRKSVSATIPPPGEILSLRVYPVKSCGGYEAKVSPLLSSGLDLDRKWMLIDSTKRSPCTIGAHPRMASIETCYDELNDQLILSVNGNGTKVQVPAHPTLQWLEVNTKKIEIGVKDKQADVFEYPSSYTMSISNLLGLDVRLVYSGMSMRRLVGDKTPSVPGRNGSTSLADAMPLSLVSEASMEELNKLLVEARQQPISIERFRPNIVVRGTKPWSEDDWKMLTITNGSQTLYLDVVSRCRRHIVPNISLGPYAQHQTQARDQNAEHGKSSHNSGTQPTFGVYCVPRCEGFMSVGMKLYTKSKIDDHLDEAIAR